MVQQSAPVPDLAPIDSLEFIEHGSSVDSFEQEVEFSSSTLFELDDDFTSDLRQGEESDARTHTAEAELALMSEDQSSQPRAAVAEPGVEAEAAYTDQPPAAQSEVHPPEQTATMAEPVSKDLTDRYTDLRKPDQQAALTDPWQEPLPSWDYSQSEWPVLMGPPRRNQIGLLRASLVVLVLLAAGGFYLFILQPALKDHSAGTPVDPKPAARLADAGHPAGSESKVSVPEAKAGVPDARASVPEAKVSESAQPITPSTSPETTAAVETRPNRVPEDANTDGKFSLQAASFPNEAAADEFAAKLKHAGVPSYTVGADLGRRGRWFRVRVGRFNSVDDAQKFASEAQRRAKAAGLSVQLIGCQYDRP